MEQSFKLQEEFEKLIEQLERLKNFNQLTTDNIESAQRVISIVNKLSTTIDDFQKEINLDFSKRSEEINKLTTELGNTINKLHQQIIIIDDKFQALSIELKKEQADSTNKLFEVIKDSINPIDANLLAIDSSLKTISESVTSVENSLYNKIQETGKIINNHTDQSIITIASLISDNHQKLIEKLDTQRKENKKVKNLLAFVISILIVGTIGAILFLKRFI